MSGSALAALAWCSLFGLVGLPIGCSPNVVYKNTILFGALCMTLPVFLLFWLMPNTIFGNAVLVTPLVTYYFSDISPSFSVQSVSDP